MELARRARERITRFVIPSEERQLRRESRHGARIVPSFHYALIKRRAGYIIYENAICSN